MKQVTIRELSQSPTKCIAKAPVEIVNRGKVVAVIWPHRKVKMPDFLARQGKIFGDMPPERIDWDKEM